MLAMIGFSEAQLSAWSGQFMWPFLRVLALFMAAPLFSHRSIPARVKVGLAMLIALIVAPLAAPSALPSLNDSAALKLVVQQILVGVGIGFCVRLTVTAIELAGELIGLQMGLSFAGFFDPSGGGQKNAMQSWMGVFAILLFLSINGHLLLIGAVTESFRLFPIQGATAAAAPFAMEPKSIVLLASKMFYIGLCVALPFIVVLLAINLTLGVVSRVAPQMNIFGVGFAATFLAGLAGLFFFTPYMAEPIARHLESGFAPFLR
jgi:flagellar biosynthesis protein FliR